MLEFNLIITSYLAGLLTVLAPCVLPLLPVIIGSSISSKDKLKPYIITGSLAISLTLFTLLLKASTALIGISPDFWKYFSGSLVVVFGIISIFPTLWDTFSLKLGLSDKSDQLLEKSNQKQGLLGSILVGMSLGPVFTSCSPTYSLILATVLPVNLTLGIVYILIYSLGLSSVLLAISILGRKLVNRLKILSNPNGIFKKVLGVVFIIVGLSIITGFDKKIETFVVESSFFDVTVLDSKLIPDNFKK